MAPNTPARQVLSAEPWYRFATSKAKCSNSSITVRQRVGEEVGSEVYPLYRSTTDSAELGACKENGACSPYSTGKSAPLFQGFFHRRECLTLNLIVSAVYSLLFRRGFPCPLGRVSESEVSHRVRVHFTEKDDWETHWLQLFRTCTNTGKVLIFNAFVVECLRLSPFVLVLERVDEECPELSVPLPALGMGEEGVLWTPPPHRAAGDRGESRK